MPKAVWSGPFIGELAGGGTVVPGAQLPVELPEGEFEESLWFRPAVLVTATDLQTPAALPSVGGENTVTLGETRPVSKRFAVIVGNGANKKFVIKHGLKTRAVVVVAQTHSSGPAELTSISGKMTALNEEEVEVEFSVAPAGKATYWLTILG